MTAVTSAAPYLSLLEEHDPSLKSYALKSLNELVDQLWAEIANNISDIEQLYEDEKFANRQLAALLASKVYYNLGDYESSVKYSLLSGTEFNISEGTEFAETIVSKCIDLYIKLSQSKFSDPSVVIDSQLTAIFEHMLSKCVMEGEYKLALGISLESYREDIVQDIIRQLLQEGKNEEVVMNLISYMLTCCTSVTDNIQFRSKLLNSLVRILLSLKTPDYFVITKIIVQLNDFNLVHKIFTDLLTSDENALIAFQIAFDLVGVASQELLTKSIEILDSDPSVDKLDQNVIRLRKILSGIPTCDLDITFLSNNNNTDISILNSSKKVLDGRNSIFHSAVTFQNAFMHAGTTDDSFFRSNLEWLGKANNWSKFSATAALGVIHKGNLSQGRSVLQPYLPGSTPSPYTNGGSLFGLGFIYAGHGAEVIDYLRKIVVDNSNSADNKNSDIILHGACLGLGVAAMALGDESIYEELKTILYADSAISGEAAALGMGLVMLGSGNEAALHDMLAYAQETQHETIVRGLTIGIALLCYGKESESEPTIEKLLGHQDSILRYGGCFTLALAYCGTSNNSAIKRLLHIAVSDSSDNVRRAAVMALGFVLLRDYTTVPTIVELLSESHNPHVRYGTAMALGISCAGRGLQAAVDVLEPLTKDAVDFVRQGATIAKSMILIQQNEKTFPAVKEFREQLAKTVANKHEDSLAKFGAALAQGIIDAGGRNVTIQLEHAQTSTLNMKAIVGLTLFSQFWYWFPLTHFLSLSFSPTSIIGVRGDLKAPKLNINCHTKPEVFGYPPKTEVQVEKQPDKIATAVLSTTARAKARAAKKDKAKKGAKEDDKMDLDEQTKEEETEGNSESVKEKKEETEVANEELQDNQRKSLYVKEPYQFENMTRVVPTQLKYVTFSKNERFLPVRKFKGMGGIVVLHDSAPNEPIEKIKTIREKSNTEAPVPDPFSIDEELDKELFEDDEDDE
nr:putative subunit of 26S proteasome [Ogataea minuta]